MSRPSSKTDAASNSNVSSGARLSSLKSSTLFGKPVNGKNSLLNSFSYNNSHASSLNFSSFKPSVSTKSVFDRYSNSHDNATAKRSLATPASSIPSVDSKPLTRDELHVVSKLEIVFTNVPTKMLHYAVRQKQTFERAADWLEDQDELSSIRPVSAAVPTQSFNSSLTKRASPFSSTLTSKREVSKPHKSIREKFSASNNAKPAKRNDSLEEIAPPPQPRRRRLLKRPNSPPLTISDDENNDSSEVDDDEDLVYTGSSRSRKKKPSTHQAPKRRLLKKLGSSSPIDISEDDSDGVAEYKLEEEEVDFDTRILQFLNTASLEDIADISAAELPVVKALVNARPFNTLDDARLVTDPSQKKSSRSKTTGEKIVDACSSTLKGYDAVDSLIQKCEELGKQVSRDVTKWGVSLFGEKGEVSTKSTDPDTDMSDQDREDEISSTSRLRRRNIINAKRSKPSTLGGQGGFFSDPPALLAPEVTLKDYQQVGINWLSLLYKKKLSCILADEMGLGKTCQVISFLAHLKEIGKQGPHLVVVPSSTLENWLREFQKFCPSLVVEPYYGSQSERADIRDALSDPDASDFDVMITTYNLACGSPADFSFLKHQKFNVCVYDEGHMLKNSLSERYNKLMRLNARFRLLLTGTPLQNNLKELISLLAFILPDIFVSRKDDLSVIFKHKARSTTHSTRDSSPSVSASSATASPDPSGIDTNTNNTPVPENGKDPLLSEQRIARAKTMMTPFVLRRKKEQVLRNLPQKTHSIEYCDLTDQQKVIYDRELEISRAAIRARMAGEKNAKVVGNVLMRLRKASLHHLLFREIYNNSVIHQMSKEIMKEPRYHDANRQFIMEDMEVMTDAELNKLSEDFPSISHHRLPQDEWLNSGKIEKLKELLPQMKTRGDRVLIFSQFTQMLDILERVLNNLGIAFLRMDGQTPVDMRQDMIDKFYEEKDITVFLLSTKAGGFGINLTCANVVIIYDLSFNPHDDKQAEDRAHRVGQTRDVQVIRLITRNTIEENILELANTKLALDRSISGETEADSEKTNEKNTLLIADQLLQDVENNVAEK